MRILNKKYWPMQIKLQHNSTTDDAKIEWCKSNIGKDRFTYFNSYRYTTYAFTNEDDALMFKLKYA